MRTLLPLIAAAMIVSPAAAGEKLAPEAQLERALEGHVAGEPVNCINLRRIRSTRIIPKTAIIYDAGRTLYVNRPRAGAESLNDWDAMVTRIHANQLCNVDDVRLVDRSSHMLTDVVMLGDFVPYERVGKRD